MHQELLSGRKYVIVEIDNLTDEMINFSPISEDDMRKNLDKDKVIIRWDNANIPNFFKEYDIYSYTEIKRIVNGPDWTPEI